MRAILNLPPSVRLIEAGIEGLVQVNKVLIETGVVPPSPLDTSVRYKRERSGLEEWDNAHEVMKRGWGDCEDLNSWECARINIEEDEWAVCSLIQTGRKLFHCIILMSDGSQRDVCPDLGMRKQGTSLEGIPWVETRAENIIGARLSRAARKLITMQPGYVRRPYRPKGSSQTLSSTRPGRGSSPSDRGEPYQPKSRRPRDPEMEPETIAPGTETATQMVSPTSASNPAMDEMPMPMMDEGDPSEDFDAEEAMAEEDEDQEEGDDV